MATWLASQASSGITGRASQELRQCTTSLIVGVDGSRTIDSTGQEPGTSISSTCGLQISHESIYLHIYADKRRGTIKSRVGINERPVIVEQKIRIGDWEGDTVIGKNHRGALVTLAERKSRYILAAQGARQTCIGGNGGSYAVTAPP